MFVKLRMRAIGIYRSCTRPPFLFCRSGSSEALACLPSDPELFVIRRSQTTEGGESSARSNDRGGQAPALRWKKKRFLQGTLAGDRPPRYGIRAVSALTNKKRLGYRRARACPSPSFRAPDPLPSVVQERLLLNRSGAGAPELQRCANRPRDRTLAGDRPPRYGKIETSWSLLPRGENKYRNGFMKPPQNVI